MKHLRRKSRESTEDDSGWNAIRTFLPVVKTPFVHYLIKKIYIKINKKVV